MSLSSYPCSTALVALVLLCSSVPALGQGARLNFRGAGQALQEDVRQALISELADHGERTRQLEDSLRTLFATLPKNSYGNLEHQAVRYALHRFFLERHGWFIRGLESGQAEALPENPQAAAQEEWVPTFLQDILEKRAGHHGSDLHEIAAIAAALEDLVKKEALARMTMIYQAHGLEPSDRLTRDDADSVLTTYFMSFLVAHNFTVRSVPELLAKKDRFSRVYKNYSEAHEWFEQVLAHRLDGMDLGVPEGDKRYNIEATTAVANDVGEQYHTFNDLECTDLRDTLQNIEGRRAGRVRLSTFYNMSRYSHWRFTEKPEYLRALGALDETDPKQPAVIIPNYVMARGNCLNAFHLYAICCRNACEDMMGKLEQKLGSPVASPEEIAAIVATLPSESVTAPRNMSASLLSRLDEVAATHDGRVPLHGRLFQQWMHHAYPLECPYPHEQGTTNPQTPAEWSRQMGQSSQASEEDMHAQVESDTCAVNWQGRSECEEAQELPWTSKEELVASHSTAVSALPQGAEEGGSAGRLLFAVLGLVALAASWFFSSQDARGYKDLQMQLPAPAVVALGLRRGLPAWLSIAGLLRVLGLACLARSVDLLNGAVLAGGVVFGLASYAMRMALGSACGVLEGNTDVKCV